MTKLIALCNRYEDIPNMLVHSDIIYIRSTCVETSCLYFNNKSVPIKNVQLLLGYNPLLIEIVPPTDFEGICDLHMSISMGTMVCSTDLDIIKEMYIFDSTLTLGYVQSEAPGPLVLDPMNDFFINFVILLVEKTTPEAIQSIRNDFPEIMIYGKSISNVADYYKYRTYGFDGILTRFPENIYKIVANNK